MVVVGDGEGDRDGEGNVALIGPSELWAPIGHLILITANIFPSYLTPRIAIPVKVAQHHNAPSSFWQRTSRKKEHHVFFPLNSENGFLKFKSKD